MFGRATITLGIGPHSSKFRIENRGRRYQGEVVLALLGTDDVGRQMSLAQPAPGEAQLANETRVEDNEDDQWTEEHEEAVQHVLVDDVVDEVALEVRLNGDRRLRHRRRIRRRARQRRIDVFVRRLRAQGAPKTVPRA